MSDGLKATNRVKMEMQKIEKNFSLYQAIKNDVGLFFVDEVDGEYEEWASNFSDEEVKRAAQKMKSLLYGKLAQIPQICPGASSCVYKHTCPFSPKEPVGKMCPFESAIVIEKVNQLKDELAINAFRETEYVMVSRLIELEILDMRISARMQNSDYQKPLLEQVQMITKHGNEIRNEVANPLFEMKEKINYEKMKLLNVLVQTPEARYKKQAALKQSSGDNYNKTLLQMENLIEQLEGKMNEKEEE